MMTVPYGRYGHLDQEQPIPPRVSPCRFHAVKIRSQPHWHQQQAFVFSTG